MAPEGIRHVECSTGQGKGKAHGSPSPGACGSHDRPQKRVTGSDRPAPLPDEGSGNPFRGPPQHRRASNLCRVLVPRARYLLLCHHERWDGIGYPRDLRGEEIPLAARISAVVDAGDAMTGGRPYWRGLLQGNVLKELKHGAGHSPIPMWSAHRRGKHVDLATAHRQRCVLQTNVRSI
ncbi:hypothetical protein J7K76_07490 [Candidatus Bipolaricaulota bacterium]|nr:hypothetical protein [Candidatus Bipolaricaulota bacterium]